MPPTNRPRPVHFITFERESVVIAGAACCAAFSAAARRPSACAGVPAATASHAARRSRAVFVNSFMGISSSYLLLPPHLCAMLQAPRRDVAGGHTERRRRAERRADRLGLIAVGQVQRVHEHLEAQRLAGQAERLLD